MLTATFRNEMAFELEPENTPGAGSAFFPNWGVWTGRKCAFIRCRPGHNEQTSGCRGILQSYSILLYHELLHICSSYSAYLSDEVWTTAFPTFHIYSINSNILHGLMVCIENTAPQCLLRNWRGREPVPITCYTQYPCKTLDQKQPSITPWLWFTTWYICLVARTT